MAEVETKKPKEHVPALAGVLASEHFPTGERASLKRMALEGPAPLAFHRFMLRHVDANWQAETWQDDWRTLICSLALQRDGGFDPQRPWGRALAEARFSEKRLERLLASRGETMRKLALRAARQLAAKGLAADWRDLADLLFSRKPEIREGVNRRIARSYYQSVQQREQKE
jgi:CRISPR system Cascade subunit CasB